MKFTCALCQKQFTRRAPNQKFCGKQHEKGSCAHKSKMSHINKSNQKREALRKNKPPVEIDSMMADRTAYDYWQA